MIKVHYFGIIAEAAKSEGETISSPGITLKSLIGDLTEKYQLDSYEFQIAVNRKIVKEMDGLELKDGDEIALLPAFSGG
ncbi:MoaD/ThiS family protein [Algoriphagus marinus]|uniref:MoaD/ThiS family protein n=1 Tax=Algoriphagus marinus TaxID=1925762 RepID=UPI00094BAD50|nr:MoaD/ThiS family protein [Algoriphagus marinus]